MQPGGVLEFAPKDWQSRDAASEVVYTGLESALRMLRLDGMCAAREYVLHPRAIEDADVLHDMRCLAGACGLRVSCIEHDRTLDLAFLLVPARNVSGYQWGLVTTDRTVLHGEGVGATREQTFAVGRYIREEATGEVLFVSTELDHLHNRDRITIIWAGKFLGHARSRRSFVTISCDAALFYAGRLVDSIVHTEISTRDAVYGCDMCGEFPSASAASCVLQATVPDALINSDAPIGPPMRCSTHLSLRAPTDQYDFSHSQNNFSVHAGVSSGFMMRVLAPTGVASVTKAPVIEVSTLLHVNTGLQLDRSALLLDIAIRKTLSELGLQSWPTTSSLPSFTDEPAAHGACPTDMGTSSFNISSPSPSLVDSGSEATEPFYVEDAEISSYSKHSCSLRAEQPLSALQGGTEFADLPDRATQVEPQRQYYSSTAHLSSRAQRCKNLPRQTRRCTKRSPCAANRFTVERPLPIRTKRGEGLSAGTPEERRKESNRLSAARASARKKIYYEELCATLAEAKSEALQLLRRLQALKDENLKLLEQLASLPPETAF